MINYELLKEVPQLEPKNQLEQMYSLQKSLLDHYISIEGLPKYPIDINPKESQKLIRDFINRLIEELAEGYQAYMKAFQLHQAHHQNDISDQVYLFNEEIGDSLHFLLELMIYSNINPEDILSYYGVLFNEQNLLDAFPTSDALVTSMIYARHCNINGFILENPRFPRDKKLAKSLHDGFMNGGRILNPLAMEQAKIQLWDVTYHLQLAANKLKNKAWKQTAVNTEIGPYQEQLMEAWLHYFRYLDFLGYEAYDIGRVYAVKNYVNQQRIKNNY